ncbi:MAG: hypothetical protein GX672_00180 [Synergistaceae bacterium]|jgi:hypothetical protein|nr:hypothetical protein [Synergistaceae bacterium]
MTKRIVAGNLPLKICSRFFEKTCVSIIPPAGDIGEENGVFLPESFNVAFHIGKVKDMPKCWDCSVSIQSLPRGDNKPLTLEYEVVAGGRFMNEDPAEETDDIILRIQVTASSVLIGMIREHIAAVTSGSPIGTHYIPPIQIAIKDEPKSKEKNAKDSKPKSIRKSTVKNTK